MNKIFIGMIFVLFNFSLTVGDMIIGLIPNFVGFFLIIRGVSELGNDKRYFDKVYSLSIIMGIYTLITYVLDFTGFSTSTDMEYVWIMLGLAATVISILIMYFIAMGVWEMESEKRVQLGGEKLKNAWSIMVLLQIGMFVGMVVPVLAVLLFIPNIAATVWFLMKFHNTKEAYMAQ